MISCDSLLRNPFASAFVPARTASLDAVAMGTFSAMYAFSSCTVNFSTCSVNFARSELCRSLANFARITSGWHVPVHLAFKPLMIVSRSCGLSPAADLALPDNFESTTCHIPQYAARTVRLKGGYFDSLVMEFAVAAVFECEAVELRTYLMGTDHVESNYLFGRRNFLGVTNFLHVHDEVVNFGIYNSDSHVLCYSFHLVLLSSLLDLNIHLGVAAFMVELRSLQWLAPRFLLCVLGCTRSLGLAGSTGNQTHLLSSRLALNLHSYCVDLKCLLPPFFFFIENKSLFFFAMIIVTFGSLYFFCTTTSFK